MPELPEVETYTRLLRPLLSGRTILSADLRWARTLTAPSPAKFRRAIAGKQIVDTARRAKFFILQLEGAALVIHLRMSGDLQVQPAEYAPAKHDRLLLALSDGNFMVFTDPRKFGRAWLMDDPAPLFTRLGPEPLGEAFTADWLYTALHARRRQLKPLLLDQCFIAGLGNIYVDESLHAARLHPLARSNTVTEAQAARLWEAIRAVLNEGIRRNGASIDWVYRGGEFQNHFQVYGRTGEACPVCGTPVERIVSAQRGTHYCPVCQNPVQ